MSKAHRLDLDSFIDPREQRRQDRFIQLGVVAAPLAESPFGFWMPEDRESQEQRGVDDRFGYRWPGYHRADARS